MSCTLLQPVAIKCVQIGIREQPLMNACHNLHIAVYESPVA